MNLSRYQHQPHPGNCDCSVCWSRRAMAQPVAYPSTPCTECRPVSLRKVDGRWKVTPASICAKHTPSNRPPRYWHVVHDTGKPTPFVPLREPFELVG